MNRDSLFSLFPICIIFIYFSFLIALDRTSSMMLKGNDERGHTFFAPNLRENLLSLSPLNILAVRCVQCTLSGWGNSFMFLVCLFVCFLVLWWILILFLNKSNKLYHCIYAELTTLRIITIHSPLSHLKLTIP